MMKGHPAQKNRFDECHFEKAGTYRICIRGVVDPQRTLWAAGMDVETYRFSERMTITEILCRLPDQAALAGILGALYDMRLPLLIVEFLHGE